MGKVFSWSEIERGEIPKLQSFVTITDAIRQKLVATNGVVGGILCGSILGNRQTRRSDIDCVVMYDPKKRNSVFKTLRVLGKSAADLYVPLELIPVDMHIARTPLHRIGLSFADHLRYAVGQGGMIKQDPLPFFVFGNTSVTEDVRSYLRNKLERLEKGLIHLPVMSVADLHRFLQKVLEAPIHVARRILLWQGIEMPNDAKNTILCFYPGIATPRECDLFKKITAADSQYTDVLFTQLKNPDQSQYAETIEGIKTLAWDVLEFVRLNALRLA